MNKVVKAHSSGVNDENVSSETDFPSGVQTTPSQGNAGELLELFAHEVRNHMAPIGNAIFLLRSRSSADASLAPLVDLIDRQMSAVVRSLETMIDAYHAQQGDALLQRAPLASSDVPEKPAVASFELESASIGGRRKVLIADDSPAVRMSFSDAITEMGHEVKAAIDGLEAITLAKQWRPDFVLLDIRMPKFNGFDVARELRAHFSPASMRLVMMSGNNLDDATVRGAREAGFDHCLDKVCALDDLQKLLGAPGQQSLSGEL